MIEKVVAQAFTDVSQMLFDLQIQELLNKKNHKLESIEQLCSKHVKKKRNYCRFLQLG
jgi:hypothetical protein